MKETMTVTKVGVLGARGKVGTAICDAVRDADDMELVAEVDQDDELRLLVDSGAEVVVDFTHPDVVMDNLEYCITNGIHAVVEPPASPTSDSEIVRGQLADNPCRVLVAPNFAIGAILMMRFAVQAARFFPSAEIVELHHPTRPTRRPAPLTGIATMMGAARAAAGMGPSPDATPQHSRARGADVDGVRVHSSARPTRRSPEVLLYTGRDADHPPRLAGPELVRPRCAAGGPKIADAPGLTVGLDSFMDL